MAKLDSLDNVISDLEQAAGTLVKIKEANEAVTGMKHSLEQLLSQLSQVYSQGRVVISSASRTADGLELTKIHLEKDFLSIEKKYDTIDQKIDSMASITSRKIEALSNEVRLIKSTQKTVRVLSIISFLLILFIAAGYASQVLNLF